MIQIFLRHPAPVRFALKKEPPTVRKLLKYWEHIAEQIPADKRYQVSYTLHNCTDTDREFAYSNIYAIDIDGIEQPDFEKTNAYINVVANTLGIPKEVMGVVDSGYGLHFLIQHKRFTTDKWFPKNKHHNKFYLDAIDQAMRAAGLSGECDPAIFNRAAMLRVPGTENRHPEKDRPPRTCRLIQEMGDINFSLDISNSPATEKKSSIDKLKFDLKGPKPDTTEIMSRCNFLKAFKDTPEDMHEPEWYAALSLTGRMGTEDKTGLQWSEEISAPHPRSTENGKTWKGHSTQTKMEYTLENSGPRTCEWLRANSKKCTGCTEQVATPLLLTGKETIATEHTGFHNIFGKKPTPVYEDLRKFFEREHNYCGLGESSLPYVYTGKNYEFIGKQSIKQYAQTHFDPAADNRMVAEFEGLVKRTNLQPMDWWQDTTKGKINFQNGYLDVSTRTLYPHTPNIGFRYVLPYEYIPMAQAPNFEKMLNMVTGNDEQTKKLLLEFIGYSLTDDSCWAQKCLLLVGEGANGKSTFLDVVAKLAGLGNYSAINMADLNRSEYNRQMLDGKLFNISEETPTKALLDSSLFKNLVTGGEVTARAIYQDPYTIRNRAKMIYSCNDLPSSADNSYGFWRRILLVRFDQTFTKDTKGYDPHILEKLIAELPGIFNLALEGFYRLKDQRSFTESGKVVEALNEYRSENDTVTTWMEENTVIHNNGSFDDHFAPTMNLYKAYRETTESEGRKPVAMVKFMKTIKKMPGKFWMDHPYEDRAIRGYAQIGDARARCKGLQGVQIKTFN